MISIAICTHDRSDDVANCLAALAPQLAGQSDELIIVDSCSTPPHAAALKSLVTSHRARFIRLEEPGHSHARNAAVRWALGEWIAFLDDDAVPFPNWLSSLHEAIDNAPQDLAAVGGLTQPLWPSNSTPAHIGRRWLFFLSCIQETARRSVRDGANVCGANLAFRKNSLLAVGGFRRDLGRVRDRLLSGEESLAIKLLLRAGWEVVYEPAIKVQHRIHSERLTEAWISKRAYWEGVTEIAMLRAMGESFPARLAVPKLAAASMILRTLFYATRNPEFLIRARMAAGSLAARMQKETAQSFS